VWASKPQINIVSHLTPYIKTLGAPGEVAGLADELGLWAGTLWSSRAEPTIAGTIGVSQPADLHLAPTISETLQLPVSHHTVTVISTATETKTITVTEYNQETTISAPGKVQVPGARGCISMSTALFLLVGGAAIGALMVYDPRYVMVGRDWIKAMRTKWPWVKSTEAAPKRNEEKLGLVGPVEMKAPANVEAKEAPANANSLVEGDDSMLLVRAGES
jgi:hypothetical protein